VDVTRYQMNLVCFLRMHRAVAGGVSPAATKHLERLSRSLAPLHGLDYVTPSLVALAAKKVYLHRLQLVPVSAPERERSVQWGSDPAAVAALLEGVGPEDVIEEVLGMVEVPG
jgi:MoxR-like ATPase